MIRKEQSKIFYTEQKKKFFKFNDGRFRLIQDCFGVFKNYLQKFVSQSGFRWFFHWFYQAAVVGNQTGANGRPEGLKVIHPAKRGKRGGKSERILNEKIVSQRLPIPMALFFLGQSKQLFKGLGEIFKLALLIFADDNDKHFSLRRQIVKSRSEGGRVGFSVGGRLGSLAGGRASGGREEEALESGRTSGGRPGER